MTLRSPITILVLTQLLFSLTDLLARAKMKELGFSVATFFSAWFVIYFAVRQIGMFGQLYVFSSLPLGKTMALLGAVSIVISNTLGALVLGEVLPVGTYIA